MIHLYYIRHAESEGNIREHLIGGRSNLYPLTDKGIRQAELLGERLKNEGHLPDRIYSSTAVRAYETARIVALNVGYPLDEIVRTPDLLELDQGEWEGVPRVQVYTPEILSRINASKGNFKAPWGESQRGVEDRMLTHAQEVVSSLQDGEGKKEAADKGEKRVYLFGHGVAIKCLARGIMDFPPELTYYLPLENTGIVQVRHDEKGYMLVRWNDHAHLLRVASGTR